MGGSNRTQWRKELRVKKEQAESAYQFMKWCDREVPRLWRDRLTKQIQKNILEQGYKLIKSVSVSLLPAQEAKRDIYLQDDFKELVFF